MMNAQLRISELADLLHARADPWKLMALLRAYFDETGLHGTSPLTGVAGFYAPAEVWEQIERDWSETLKRLSGVIGREVAAFHATDCEQGRNDWQGVARPIREAFHLRFAEIVCSHKDIHGTCRFVIQEDWDKLTTPEFRAFMGSPYQFCAELCFKQIGMWTRGGPYIEAPVALVMAEHQKLSSRANEIFSHYMETKAWTHIKSLTFASPNDCLPLQCADLLAYEAFSYWLSLEQKGLQSVVGNERQPMQVILGKGKAFITCHGGRGLALDVKRWHLSQRLHDPYPEL